jgi:hypothetical protein
MEYKNEILSMRELSLWRSAMARMATWVVRIGLRTRMG